ncbi:MAG: hypothetical protein M3072_00935 [Candidatus Dormibacteraeota bacterium]|nr:hypothetical protein [Candidatus Dormibacteraeota bacterium]
MNASTSVGERTAGSSCELEEHIEEVRARNEELGRLLTERPFDAQVLDAVWLQVEAVRELLDHCGGLHEPDVLVRALES